MVAYVALLRGINLGSKRRVSMPELRALASGLGLVDVRTQINSGNLIFASDQAEGVLQRSLARAIEERFGFAVPVVIRTADQLRRVLSQAPFPEGSPSQVCVASFATDVPGDAAAKVAELAAPTERHLVGRREIHVDFAGGLARSKLAAKLSALGADDAVTVRNVATLAKLVALLE